MHHCLEGDSETRIQCTTKICSIQFPEYILRSVYNVLTDCIISVVETASLRSKNHLRRSIALVHPKHVITELVLKLNSELLILGRSARYLISNFYGFPQTQQANCIQTFRIHYLLYTTYSSFTCL
jgi:hypothetical protein